MTGAPRRLASKGVVRLTAWASAAAAFLAAWGVLGALPRPTASAAVPVTRPRQVVVVKKILRRVIIQEAAPAAAPSIVTYTPSSSGSSSPPAPTSTGGSAP
jgi:hypothetical protein